MSALFRRATFTGRSLAFLFGLFLGALLFGALSPCAALAGWIHIHVDAGDSGDDSQLPTSSGILNPASNGAVLVNPRLLLASLDEPTMDVDPVAIDGIVELAAGSRWSRPNVVVDQRSIGFTAGNVLAKDEPLVDTSAIAVLARAAADFDMLRLITGVDRRSGSADATNRLELKPLPARHTLAVAGVGVF